MEDRFVEQTSTQIAGFSEAPPRVSAMRRFFRVFFRRGLVVFGAVVILALIVVAAFAPLVAPHDPYKIDLKNKLAEPSMEHPLGTDTLGRDSLSRIIYGSRTSLLVGIVAVGMGYTLQVIGQKGAPAADAALLLSLEAVFAALFGWWFLGELLTPRQVIGCGLMLGGMLLAQLSAREGGG